MVIYLNAWGEVINEPKKIPVITKRGAQAFCYALVQGEKVTLTRCDDRKIKVDSDIPYEDECYMQGTELFRATLKKAKDLAALLKLSQTKGHKHFCLCPVCRSLRGERPVVRKQVLVKLPGDLLDSAREMAKERGATFTDLIESALRRELEERRQAEEDSLPVGVPSVKEPPSPKKQRGRKKPFKLAEDTERKLSDWMKNTAQVEIELLNGELFKGFVKWYNQDAVKLATMAGEIMIPHSSVAFYKAARGRRRRIEEFAG